MPHSLSVPKMVWFRLPEQEPVWDDQHEFLGWSRDPEADKTEMKAGSAAVFGEDTKLYAVWKAQYKVIEGAVPSGTKAAESRSASWLTDI